MGRTRALRGGAHSGRRRFLRRAQTAATRGTEALEYLVVTGWATRAPLARIQAPRDRESLGESHTYKEYTQIVILAEAESDPTG